MSRNRDSTHFLPRQSSGNLRPGGAHLAEDNGIIEGVDVLDGPANKMLTQVVHDSCDYKYIYTLG